MARARALGEHIMQAVATPAEERHWLGEEDMGWCPNRLKSEKRRKKP